jgi:hypothetical protein
MNRKEELTRIWKSPNSSREERGAAMRELQALTSNRPAHSLVERSMVFRPGTKLR